MPSNPDVASQFIPCLTGMLLILICRPRPSVQTAKRLLSNTCRIQGVLPIRNLARRSVSSSFFKLFDCFRCYPYASTGSRAAARSTTYPKNTPHVASNFRASTTLSIHPHIHTQSPSITPQSLFATRVPTWAYGPIWTVKCLSSRFKEPRGSRLYVQSFRRCPHQLTPHVFVAHVHHTAGRP
ncbi:hypothetical protein BD779DRAFT_213749 [Infundibulicybe gibba]|nr:hypothetical protein BD779DRAFT_213749 [Infundibulicybe gibba]